MSGVRRRNGGEQWQPAARGLALAALAALAVLPSLGAEPVPAPPTVCILLSHDVPPYRQAVEGAKQELDKAGPHRYVELILTGQSGDELLKKITHARPRLILTVGTEAAKMASIQIEGIPVVFAMVANPVDSGVLPRRAPPDQMVAGVTTDVSPAQQFEALRLAIPGAKRVAVIYCPQYTEATVAAGEKAAKEAQMELVKFPVQPYRVDEALGQLSRERVDAIWTLTDPGVVVPATAKRILVFSLRAKVPVIGFSGAMVRAGALLGFEVESKSIGKQAGAMAQAILHEGKKPADFPLTYPAQAILVANPAVAKQIGVTLSEAMLAKAQLVQEERGGQP